MNRVLVVPWSRAPTYCAICATPFATSILQLAVEHEFDERQVVDDRRERAADERTDDGNPRIAPIRIPLTRNRQQEGRDPRPKVSGGVDRVSGRTAERQADDEDEE